MSLACQIQEKYPGMRVLFDEPLSRHITFSVGGPADIMAFPRNEEELSFLFKKAASENIPVTVIGNGSNLIVKDGGIQGLTIVLGEDFSGITVSGNEITAAAGELLSRIARTAYNHSLTGLEFASGIPGSLGGGMAMNAGAYGGQLSDVCVSARVFDPETGEIRQYQADELELGYRTSMPLKTRRIVTQAKFRLKAGDKEEILKTMEELNARRREKQPLAYPSAGSTFKRPEGYFAGALIESAGLKGASVGGAQVSTLHAGFIINTGNATAKDILDLIKHVQTVVFEKHGVNLETEVRILGE
ncbi:MAG: UDP-N-acetylmuramate dehydrogenase [Clostridia bacterium]|nr:UDP-N-acetylmuramate dehydrogenase [Clostridia bacterium]